MSDYNYYNATFTYCTAKRAQSMGIKIGRHYGYAVLINPPVMTEGRREGCERLQSWCKSKGGAQQYIEDQYNAIKKGYHGCPCGSNKQARACCGIPKKENKKCTS